VRGARLRARDLTPGARSRICGLFRRAHIALGTGVATLLLAAAPAPAAAPEPDPVTRKPCFGAATRDPLKRCFDPSLRTTVYPKPADAPLEPNAPCVPGGRTPLLYPCRFGVRSVASGAGAGAAGTIALIGDSHASHWRGAVEVVAEGKGVPGVSLARSRCPFVDATILLPHADALRCRGWQREVKAYLADHPEITTIFVSDRSSARVVPDRGRSNLETQVAGYIALWHSLPATVEHIIVIRDTPRSSAASALCVQQAYAARKPSAGQVCARLRVQALHVDPAIVAARRMHSPRVHAVDLSDVFCDAQRCFPVIGGAFVYKDVDHISAVFARTLGPLLLRAYDDILGEPPAPPPASGGSAPPGGPGPLDILIADEREAAECLLAERLAASQAGGFENVPPENLARANACRAMLERRAAEIKAAGLTGERNRKHRYEVIVAVLET
jgi:hypothetical protein